MPRNWQRAGAAVKGAGSDGGASENRPMNPGHPGRLSTSGSGKYRRIGPQPAGGARDEPARDRVAGRVAEAQEGAARPREGADPADRPAERRPPAPADGGGDQGLRIRGTGGPREPAGHVPGPSPARAAALHVRPVVGRRLLELHRGRGRAAGLDWLVLLENQPCEQRGVSFFLRDGDDVLHTYSTFARGTEMLGGA